MPNTPVFDCKHDTNDPDHIICIQRGVKKKSSHQFVAYLQNRYDQYYHPRHTHRHLHRIVDSVLVSIIILFFGAYIFSLFGKTSEHITITMMPPSTIRGGEEISITVAYKNSNYADILNAHIELMLPENFIAKEFGGSQVSPKRNIRLDIGLIPRGAKGTYILRGIPLESLDKEQSFIASLVGIRKQDQGEEHAISYLHYTIPTSALEIRTEFPQAVLFQQSFTGAIHVKNTASHPVEDIRMNIVIPDGFLPSKPLPKELSIHTLAPGEEYTLPLKGRFSHTDATELSLHVYTSLYRGMKNFLQSSVSIPIAIQQKIITLSIEAEGGAEGISEDKKTSYILRWKNTSDIPLSRLSLGVFFDTDSIDMSSLTVPNGISDGKHTLVWTPGTIHELEHIQAGESGMYRFDGALKKLKTSDPIRLIPFASYYEVDSNTRIEINGDTASFIRNSPLSLMAFARYYTPEGEQIGRGPLPPIVAQTTRYHIFLLPEGIIHPLKNVITTATLSPRVSWTGIVPLGSDGISYNKELNSISWKSSSFTPGGDESPNGVVFEIALTPEQEDTGKEIDLLTAISIQAEDAVTHSSIRASAKNITTKLIYDQKATNAWAVQK